jgi:transcription antitermination factor NusG
MHGGGVMAKYELTDREELSWQRARRLADLVGWLRSQAAARDGDRFWYVVRTWSDNADEVANEFIKAGIEAWCPMVKVVKRQPRGRGQRAEIVAMFPRYFFARVVAFEAAWLGVMSFDGVDCLLGTGERPTPVPERVIEDIHRICDGNVSPVQAQTAALGKGDRVVIEVGPFAFLEGTVLRSVEAGSVVDIELDVFGRLTPCRMGVDDLKRLA